jgi:hypothetical protein
MSSNVPQFVNTTEDDARAEREVVVRTLASLYNGPLASQTWTGELSEALHRDVAIEWLNRFAFAPRDQ